MNNDPSQGEPGLGEDGAEDSQVRTLDQSARKPPGKKTGMLAAVISEDPRIIGRSAQPGEANPEGVVDKYVLELAQDLRRFDPNFTAEKYQARASGAKPTIRMPAQAVIRRRKTKWGIVIVTILMFVATATIVARLIAGIWPWTLLWREIFRAS